MERDREKEHDSDHSSCCADDNDPGRPDPLEGLDEETKICFQVERGCLTCSDYFFLNKKMSFWGDWGFHLPFDRWSIQAIYIAFPYYRCKTSERCGPLFKSHFLSNSVNCSSPSSSWSVLCFAVCTQNNPQVFVPSPGSVNGKQL